MRSTWPNKVIYFTNYKIIINLCFWIFRTGYEILDKLLEKPSHLRIVIHLLKIFQPDQYEVDLWQLNSAQRLKSLERFQAEGNFFFTNVSLKYF